MMVMVMEKVATLEKQQSILGGDFELFFNGGNNEDENDEPLLEHVLFGKYLVNRLPIVEPINIGNSLSPASIQRLMIATLWKGKHGFNQEVIFQTKSSNGNQLPTAGKYQMIPTELDEEITNSGFKHLIPTFSFFTTSSISWSFEHLCFGNWDLLSDDALLGIIGNCPKVRSLDIRNCYKLDKNILQKIEAQFPQVQWIQYDPTMQDSLARLTNEDATAASSWSFPLLCKWFDMANDHEMHERRHWLYPNQLLLGSVTHGMTLVDPRALLTKPTDYCRRICDPIEVDQTIFASLASVRNNDQCYATMWSDYRTDRQFPYELDKVLNSSGKLAEMASWIENRIDGIHGVESQGSLPCLRCLDAALMKIVKDKYFRTCGWILSLSDGYEHPHDDREQIEISKAAAMVCEGMAASLSDRMKQNERKMDASLTKSLMASVMSHTSAKVWQDIRNNGILDYVGSGNVTVAIHSSTISSSSSISTNVPVEHAVGESRPGFIIDTVSVGDCLAFVFDPTRINRSNPDGSSIKILTYPKQFLMFTNPVTGTKDYQPFSVTRLESNCEVDSDDDGSNQWWMVDHSCCGVINYGAMVFLMSDGCWEKFSNGWKESNDIHADSLTPVRPYMKPDIDTVAIERCLQECWNEKTNGEKNEMESHNIQSYVNALRNETMRRAETNRQELHNCLNIFREFKTSSNFTEGLYMKKDAETGRFNFVSWKDCCNNDEISPELSNAVEYIIDLEKFSNDVPFLTVLNHKPSIGDDCTILGFALPSKIGEDVIEDLIEVYAHSKKDCERRKCFEKILLGPDAKFQSLGKKALDELFVDIQRKKYIVNQESQLIQNNLFVHRGNDDGNVEFMKYPCHLTEEVWGDLKSFVNPL